MSGDHFYCLDPHGELAPELFYEYEGITGFVFTTNQPDTVPIYRWMRPGDHFYTADPTGELAPELGYVSEGIGWYMYPTQKAGTIPLYRWRSTQIPDHFYTTDPNGELAPALGYIAEGITGYLYPSQSSGTSALHRWMHSDMFRTFIFNNTITAAQRRTLLERHAFAYYRSGICNNLNEEERTRVREAYRRAITHDINTDPNANASAIIGGSQIWVNFDNLFPLGDREIAQSLLHEMMHCAGYNHPVRRNTDVPGDGGAYYNSPPLRAELCIAGIQSDAGTTLLSLAPYAGEPRACPVVSVENQP
ncbi:uncharacterized protein K441DRAFT_656443 [Cenococcum geophilum 1.58]|uniref:uncharacterized protein n=1 Tax=Cenococcum geophilum 1.58 TaxID=794803 RepID=UPI00358FAA3D|nr:hypothetical protein K441DRAFT_656443 [Cenococcum geophilum 1.58]